MNTQALARLLVTVALFFTPALANSFLQAVTIYPYNFDSLVHMSTDVVHVEIDQVYKDRGPGRLRVKVVGPYKGRLAKGQSVDVIGTRSYRKCEQIHSYKSQPLSMGDQLVMFLVRSPPNRPLSKNAAIYEPLTGGMRLIEEDHLFDFRQWNSPGPMVAHVAADPAKVPLASFEQFPKRIRQGLRETREWADLVDANQDSFNSERLLELLAQRKPQRRAGRDFFSEQICIRFTELRDFALLGRALSTVEYHRYVRILNHGFGTPEGRDYLLAKVADSKEPMSARLRYSRAMHDAGAVYRSSNTNIRSGGYSIVGKVDDGNSHYLRRIARTAQSLQTNETLCLDLLRSVDYFGRGIVQNNKKPLREDLLGALAVLKEIYETKPSELVQFVIERATACDRVAYEKLNSPCGPLISIVGAVDPSKYTKPKTRSLIFGYSYRSFQLSPDATYQPQAVLVHTKTQSRLVLPTKITIRGASSGGGSGSVVLPEDLPAGKYRVFLQLRDGAKVISQGHSFFADL